MSVGDREPDIDRYHGASDYAIRFSDHQSSLMTEIARASIDIFKRPEISLSASPPPLVITILFLT